MKKITVILIAIAVIIGLNRCATNSTYSKLMPIPGIWQGKDSIGRYVTFLFSTDSLVSIEIKPDKTANNSIQVLRGYYKVNAYIDKFWEGEHASHDSSVITGYILNNRQKVSFSFVHYALQASNMHNSTYNPNNGTDNLAKMTGFYGVSAGASRIPVQLINFKSYHLY
ncbi:MAG: hypothetical protein IPK18_07845 [Sphingobacteriales bacterium]|jgi:hypothetical protein|nr:MAG: hypothetical protein IPK18_07845 [Sphingobacteriales bacterium]